MWISGTSTAKRRWKFDFSTYCHCLCVYCSWEFLQRRAGFVCKAGFRYSMCLLAKYHLITLQHAIITKIKCVPPWASQVVLVVKKLPANAGDVGLISGVGKIPWRRGRPPTPVFLPVQSHGQSSLAGYSPWSCKQTQLKRLSTHERTLVRREMPATRTGDTEQLRLRRKL